MISRSSFFIKTDLSTPMLIVKVTENNTMYSAQELHFFYVQSILFKLFLLLQQFNYIIQPLYLLTFSHNCNFHSLIIPLHHMICHIHTHSYLGSKENLYRIPCQSIIFIHIGIYLHPTFAYCCKHLHLVYIDIYKFHAVLCVLFHWLLTLN